MMVTMKITKKSKTKNMKNIVFVVKLRWSTFGQDFFSPKGEGTQMVGGEVDLDTDDARWRVSGDDFS